MSGFYAKISNISGSKSTVATSAYISRKELKDEQMNHTFNYSKHSHDEIFDNVKLCANAPAEWQDATTLWNAVEKNEQAGRKAKHIINAIPQEIKDEKIREKLIEEYQEWLAEKGMCSQAVIHTPESKRSALAVEKNLHVHILTTQRLVDESGEWVKAKQKQEYANDIEIDADGHEKPIYNPDKPNDKEHRIPKLDPEKVKAMGEGFSLKASLDAIEKITDKEKKAEAREKLLKQVQKTRIRKGKGEEKEWSRCTVEQNPLYKHELIEEMRAKWSEVCNKYLSEGQKIDHRSYDRQGIDKVAEIHEGVGYYHQDERTEFNKVVREVNKKMEQMKAEAPEQLPEIRSDLDAIRTSFEYDRDSIRTEQASHRTAGADTQNEGSSRPEEYPNSTIREKTADEGAGVSVSAAGVHDRIGRIRGEQHTINGKADSLRTKLRNIGEKLAEFTRSIKQKAESISNGFNKQREETPTVKENTMAGMSRFAQIQAETQLAREQEQGKERQAEQSAGVKAFNDIAKKQAEDKAKEVVDAYEILKSHEGDLEHLEKFHTEDFSEVTKLVNEVKDHADKGTVAEIPKETYDKIIEIGKKDYAVPSINAKMRKLSETTQELKAKFHKDNNTTEGEAITQGNKRGIHV